MRCINPKNVYIGVCVSAGLWTGICFLTMVLRLQQKSSSECRRADGTAASRHMGTSCRKPGRVDDANVDLPSPAHGVETQSVVYIGASDHGAVQVRRMLADRPKMRYPLRGTPIRESDKIYQWAQRQFAGERTGVPIYWNSDPPNKSGEYLADHRPPIYGHRGFIRIREMHLTGATKGQELSFEEAWRCAVFELLNIGRVREFESIYRMVFNGKLDKNSWIRLNTEVEYATCIDTAEFYVNSWRPWMCERGIDTNEDLWFVNIPTSYQAWISMYRNSSGYPWDYLGDFYDTVIRWKVRYKQSHNTQSDVYLGDQK